VEDRRLPADPAELGLLPVEGFAQLEIPVPDLQETDRFQIHRVHCTGTKAFRNGGSRNDWVWVQTGGEANSGDLRGCVVARLLALFKISNIISEAAAVHRLALVRILDPINGVTILLLNTYATGNDRRFLRKRVSLFCTKA